ncbi:hypothetical protein [Bradyrhizobium sp. CCBAU 51765]|nr:hypothetical protein [Bradyrhizobium sp. CCBAU 51765]
MLKKTFLAQSLASLASTGTAFGNNELKTLVIFLIDRAEPLASPAP